jgi:hypothetical protein
VRATPDGHMELRGVAPERFQLESGMFFPRADLPAARADFAELLRLGAENTPCRAFVQLADRGAAAEAERYVTALIYPAEYEDDIAHWLLDAGYRGGDRAEGGASHVTNYYHEANTLLERQQLWSRVAIPSRSREEVYANVHLSVQR